MADIHIAPSQSNVIEVEINGTLSKQDCAALLPTVKERIIRFGSVRILVHLRDFRGWNLRAFDPNPGLGLQGDEEVEQVAIVGDRRWEHGMSLFCRRFRTVGLEYFEPDELNVARAWIQAC